MHCKHWMGVFEGVKQKYIGLSEKQIKEIQSWLSGSDIESAWKEYEKIKEKEIKIKKEISREKKAVMKKLDKAMLEI